MRIYPNPVHATLYFDMEDINESEIIVQDITGRILMHHPLNENSKELNVETLLPGVYIISVLFKDVRESHLIAVQ